MLIVGALCDSRNIRNALIFSIIFTFVFYLYSQPSPTETFTKDLQKMREFYQKSLELQQRLQQLKQNNSTMLKSILKAEYQPRKNGKSIFFIESHKPDDQTLALTPRQACSIESAGRTNLWTSRSLNRLRFSSRESRVGHFRVFLLRSWIFE